MVATQREARGPVPAAAQPEVPGRVQPAAQLWAQGGLPSDLQCLTGTRAAWNKMPGA